MKAGTKVMCVDDGIKQEMMVTICNYYHNWVKKGKTYTVREVLQNDDIVHGVLLEEVRNEPIYIELIDKKQEPAFGMFRFRELEDDRMMESVEHYVEMI
jgi:hypothetical protein